MKTNLLLTFLTLSAAVAFAVQPQTKSWVNKDARLFVQHYEKNNTHILRVREDFLTGDFWEIDPATDISTLNWDDGAGGKETWDHTGHGDDSVNGPSTSHRSTVNTWPATLWPNLVNGTFVDSPVGSSDDGPYPPYIILQHQSQKTKQDYSFWSPGGYDFPYFFYGPYIEDGHITDTPHAQVVLKFFAGGMGLPKRPSVYRGSVSVVSHKQKGVIGIYNTPTYENTPIASQNITLGDLGPLDPDGILYAKIDDGSTKDITPTVANTPYYTFGWPVLTKYTLTSQVSCQARDDTNYDRTTLGVGETTTLYELPDETGWSTTAGTLSATVGGATALTAPHAAATATVTATIRKVKLTIDFGVVEPSGISSTIRSRDGFDYGQVGAGMQIDVVIQPTTVSFGNVEIEEPGANATSLQGYFTYPQNTPPNHDSAHGANAWHRVICDNYVPGPPTDFFDHAWSGGQSIGQGGSYTWPISAIWRVVGDTASHSLSGWTDQIMTLSSDGTMRVDKLGHNVVRHTYETYGVAQ